MVLVEAHHEECHLVVANLQSKLIETLDQVLHARRAGARLIEDSESIDEIEISFETKLNLDQLDVVFEL